MFRLPCRVGMLHMADAGMEALFALKKRIIMKR